MRDMDATNASIDDNQIWGTRRINMVQIEQ